MLKFGICNEKDLRDEAKQNGFWGDPKNIAIDLYDSAETEQLAERVLNRFTDETGVYKRTYRRRFEEFDDLTLKILRNSAFTSPLVVYDLGVSDARTSVDFYSKILSVSNDLRFYAIDFDPEVTVIQHRQTKVVLNNSGEVLQMIHPPFVFNATNRDSYRLYPLNHAVRLILQYAIVPQMLKKYRANQLQYSRKLTLFSRRAIDLAHDDARFHLERHDVLQAFATLPPAAVIRAMNLFHLDNFSRQQISVALQNVFDALMMNGLFVTGSNEDPDSPINGGIYQKTETRFEMIQLSGEGSPVADLIVNFTGRRVAR